MCKVGLGYKEEATSHVYKMRMSLLWKEVLGLLSLLFLSVWRDDSINRAELAAIAARP